MVDKLHQLMDQQTALLERQAVALERIAAHFAPAAPPVPAPTMDDTPECCACRHRWHGNALCTFVGALAKLCDCRESPAQAVTEVTHQEAREIVAAALMRHGKQQEGSWLLRYIDQQEARSATARPAVEALRERAVAYLSDVLQIAAYPKDVDELTALLETVEREARAASLPADATEALREWRALGGDVASAAADRVREFNHRTTDIAARLLRSLAKPSEGTGT